MNLHPHLLIKSLSHFHYVYHSNIHQIEGNEDQTSKMSLSFMSSNPNNFKESIHSDLTVIKRIIKSKNELFEALVGLVTCHWIVNDESILIWKHKCSQKQSLKEPDPSVNIFPWFGRFLLLYFLIADPATIHSALRSSTSIFNKYFFGTKPVLLGPGA